MSILYCVITINSFHGHRKELDFVERVKIFSKIVAKFGSLFIDAARPVLSVPSQIKGPDLNFGLKLRVRLIVIFKRGETLNGRMLGDQCLSLRSQHKQRANWKPLVARGAGKQPIVSRHWRI